MFDQPWTMLFVVVAKERISNSMCSSAAEGIRSSPYPKARHFGYLTTRIDCSMPFIFPLGETIPLHNSIAAGEAFQFGSVVPICRHIHIRHMVRNRNSMPGGCIDNREEQRVISQAVVSLHFLCKILNMSSLLEDIDGRETSGICASIMIPPTVITDRKGSASTELILDEG